VLVRGEQKTENIFTISSTFFSSHLPVRPGNLPVQMCSN
jgi:hypothetical protein